MHNKIIVMLTVALCIGLCACGADKTTDMTSYIGNTYVGTSPWGEKVSITVEKYDAEEYETGSIDLTYRENIDSEHAICCTWGGNMVSENSVDLSCAGSQEDGDYGVKYEYDLKIIFKDGNLEMTYLDGQKNELSDEGGSGFHHVGALPEEEKTVVLELSNEENEPEVESEAEALACIYSPIEGEYTVSREFSDEHNGIDIVAPEGTKLLACFDGYVVDVGEDEEKGKYVVIKSKDGYTASYEHCNNVFVNIDDEVQAGEGDGIGTLGNTGQSTGAHLHFSLKGPNGKFLNPVEYIK